MFPVSPLAPGFPVSPLAPVFPVSPLAPAGPLNAPTLTQPLANVELIIEATHKLPLITYPSPAAFVEGNEPVFATAPFIRMVPGLTPPILEPVGISSVFPILLSWALPMLMVFDEVKISRT